MGINSKKYVLFLAGMVIYGIQAGTAYGIETDEVLARVNGSADITRAEVDRVIRIYIAQNRVSHDISPEARKLAEDAALEQLISTKLLYQAGVKLEIMNLDKQILDKINQEKSKFATPAAYDAVLKSNNFTEHDAQEIVRTDIIVTNLINKEIISRITINESDARKYYDHNLEKFTKPESIRLRHILIEVDPRAVTEEKQHARQKAESIRKRIIAGEDFVAIAKADSSCPSKEQGGDLGIFQKGEMIPEFESAAAAIKPGEISQVVETISGYHILTFEEKKDVSVTPFDEVKVKIAQYLKQTGTQQAIMAYVAGLKKKATIVMTAVK